MRNDEVEGMEMEMMMKVGMCERGRGREKGGRRERECWVGRYKKASALEGEGVVICGWVNVRMGK